MARLGAILMNLDHLNLFLEAMHRRDAAGLEPHMSADVTLRSPIVPEPFNGKAQVQSVMSLLLGIVDSFELLEILPGEAHVATFFKLRVGPTEVDGMDYVHLNDAGLIDSLVVLWRPLPSIVAIQNRLAPLIGIAPLQLMEASAA